MKFGNDVEFSLIVTCLSLKKVFLNESKGVIVFPQCARVRNGWREVQEILKDVKTCENGERKRERERESEKEN